MQGQGLEIGPSHYPIAPKKEGYNVHILDHLDKEGLIKKYTGHEDYGVNVQNIEDVDFVWHGESLIELTGMVGRYDWIIASHVIKHIPDLISFLQQCEALLKPEGHLALVVPDKRYCFDYFASLTTTGHLLDAFTEKRITPTHGQLFDHFANACKLGDKIAWFEGAGGEFSLMHTVEQAISIWKKSLTDSSYVDVHCWRFVPNSFAIILDDLHQLELLKLCISSQFDTSGCEFYVFLGFDCFKEEFANRVSKLLSISF